VVAGGIFFMLAAALTHRVEDVEDLQQAVGALPRNVAATKS